MFKNVLKLILIAVFLLTSLLCCGLTEAFAVRTVAVSHLDLSVSPSNGDHETTTKDCACSSSAVLRSKARGQQFLSKIGISNGFLALDGLSSLVLGSVSLKEVSPSYVSVQSAAVPLYIQYCALRI
jgi:hypothetical protein